jgi:hypothetical protein
MIMMVSLLEEAVATMGHAMDIVTIPVIILPLQEDTNIAITRLP